MSSHLSGVLVPIFTAHSGARSQGDEDKEGGRRSRHLLFSSVVGSQNKKDLSRGSPTASENNHQLSVGFQNMAEVNRTCYVWGYAKNGRLGRGDEEDALMPVSTEALKNLPVSELSCGYNHAARDQLYGRQ